jgi:hypothetical protein
MALFLISGIPSYAESVFLKSGSIIEGKIIKEDDLSIDIRTETGEKRTIQRKEVIRTLYHTKYKERKVIKKKMALLL